MHLFSFVYIGFTIHSGVFPFWSFAGADGPHIGLFFATKREAFSSGFTSQEWRSLEFLK